MHKFKENYKPTYGDMSTALGAETSPAADTIETDTYVDMRYYDALVVYGIASGVASDAVLTLTIQEATATDGSASATTTQTDTFTSTHVTDTDVMQAEIRGEQLSSGYRYAGAIIASDDNSCTGIVTMLMLQGRARYGQATLP